MQAGRLPGACRSASEGAVAFTFEGTGREGIVAQRQAGGGYTFTDELVSRFEAYADPRAAFEAAGLSE